MSNPNKMFRQESLERLSSPERLDQLMNVVERRAWIPLAVTGSLFLAGALWSVFGRLPLNVTGQGVLIVPRRVVQFQAPSQGQVLEIKVKPGDIVKKGDVIATLAQPSLDQELQQQKDTLAQLQKQKQETIDLQRKRISLEKNNIALQKANLETTLEREGILPTLRQKNLDLLAKNRETLRKRLANAQQILPDLKEKNFTALQENRESLQQQIAQIKQLLPTLEKRLESRRDLLRKQLITGDALLVAEQEYLNNLAQLSNLEAQLKQIDVQLIDGQRQYLDSLNSIDDIRNKIQEINVQETDLQRQYLESLNKVDDLKSRMDALNSQEAKLNQEALETTIDKANRIEETKQKIAQLEQQLSQKSQIVSQYNGQVLELAAVPGQLLNIGTRFGSIQAEDPNGKLMSVVYFADKDGKQVKPDMAIQVTPSLVKRERYGGIVGKVTTVSPFPVATQDMVSVIGNENVANTLQETLRGSATIQVFAELETDSNTASGYKWSSSDGPPILLTPGTTTQVRVKVGEIAPISYVIPLFRNLTGVY